MKTRPVFLSHKFLICLFSLFLIGAGISRYIETDSGNILIHDIDIENYEGFIYKGRPFRQIQASSMNLRPGILLVFGSPADRYTGDHIAMEFARRGFVVLTIEDFLQGMTDPEPDFLTENMIDAGYTFLFTRTFTDHERLGIIAFYSAAEKAADSQYFQLFSSRIFVNPPTSVYEQNCPAEQIYIPIHETDQKPLTASFENNEIRVYQSSPAGMIFDRSVIADLMEEFHKALSIPNDSPFWFNASQQRAQILLCLRFSLLVLLLVIITIQGTLLTQSINSPALSAVTGIIIPLLFFFAVEEFMNFFLISIRLGIPFNYLPRFIQLIRNFSAPTLIFFVLYSFLSSFSLGKNKLFFVSDLLTICGALICLCGLLPLLSQESPNWFLIGTANYRLPIFAFTSFAFLNSILLRFPGKNIFSRHVCAILNGIVYYWISSSLLLKIL